MQQGGFFAKARNIASGTRRFFHAVKLNGLASIARGGSGYEIFRHGVPPAVYPVPEFNQAFDQPNFPERYRALLRGLDGRSVADAAFIVNGLRRSAEGASPLEIFTAADKAAIFAAGEALRSGVVRLSDEDYVFGHYHLPQNKFDASVFIYHNGIDHLDNLSSLKDRTILDVGGFIGDSSLIFAPLTSGEIRIFEPVSANCRMIRKTVELNRLSRIHVEHLALGAAPGELEVHGFSDLTGSTSSAADLCLMPTGRDESLKFSEKAMVETLDNYVERNGIDNVGLIKVDIEGAEQQFLAGAEKTIKSQRPTLLLSIYHNPDDFFDIKPLLEGWDLGYAFKIRRCPGEIFIETQLIAEVAGR